MAASLASIHLGRNNLQKDYSTAKAPPTRPDQRHPKLAAVDVNKGRLD